MPLFGGDKFSPKAPPERKSTINGRPVSLYDHSGPRHFDTDLSLDVSKVIDLRLGDFTARFDDGHWSSSGGPGETASSEEVLELKHGNKTLREENNLLKLKVELLLDMLTEITAECHLQEDELKKIRAETAAKNTSK